MCLTIAIAICVHWWSSLSTISFLLLNALLLFPNFCFQSSISIFHFSGDSISINFNQLRSLNLNKGGMGIQFNYFYFYNFSISANVFIITRVWLIRSLNTTLLSFFPTRLGQPEICLVVHRTMLTWQAILCGLAEHCQLCYSAKCCS